jgi:hypothetical protein
MIVRAVPSAVVLSRVQYLHEVHTEENARGHWVIVALMIAIAAMATFVLEREQPHLRMPQLLAPPPPRATSWRPRPCRTPDSTAAAPRPGGARPDTHRAAVPGMVVAVASRVPLSLGVSR